MREESQLDDMRSAIRGDFDRLAARRGGQELMRVTMDEPEASDDPDTVAAEHVDGRSWLARLLAR